MAKTKPLLLVNVYTVSLAIIAVHCGWQLVFHWPVEWFAVSLLATLLLGDLGFTMAEHRRRDKADTSPTPAIIRNPRLIELALAEAHLAGLRATYKSGRISGHPEDNLWDIEDAEKHVRKLRSGTD
ncbi:hypothetical protein Achl_4251 (plasmid) [Pseudarthrobacter chlorophenolicus A6]|uniref:Uncharacterized protein n=1 Tax=Pseudarthrobacter chlorophenolicus (strain ATCC 700700 / DSM 12829 / CIP 107037 / JCM 12360 / KCTC 9906 / NCIMB 13794 / A6) TaxID=452863 RepID=B8HIF5_PSECP|nr:hypothetical protein [Pseudarthrobacter chlorophenolicus]ACL42202.1 hypothetical protein Achl_4251 [Pseudarthrobacter chlorophenolicus A6]SDQ14819.1 hypothetical protein SAMN04489738_0309 [Pseudarthrobacter chlorophenolicus]